MSTSALGPVDRDSLPAVEERDKGPLAVGADSGEEKERSAPWIMRKLVGSMTGRIVMSSYESLRAAGTSVICLSPWGDSSPLLLPCIRFRDLAVHTIIAATGGMAIVAAPVMGPVSAEVIGSLGDSILVEVGLREGFQLTTNLANDLVIGKSVSRVIPIYSNRLETTAVKVLIITLKFKHTIEDAALGFYRSSVHEDSSLFASVKDYLAIEKGWFSPYLFASSRRPIIPRSMKPDVIFCHGPFLEGDYRVGESLLAESASVILLCATPEPVPPTPAEPSHFRVPKLDIPALSNKFFSRSRTPSPEPALAPLPVPPTPRRLVIVVVGLKPHRSMWTTSARPGESVLQYVLLNGCPAIVVPVKIGAPLVAWDTFTLKELWTVTLPPEGEDDVAAASERFDGIVNVLNEFLGLCVDWERMVLEVDSKEKPTEEEGKSFLKNSLKLLVAAAVRSGESKAVRKEVDEDRSGIAMWRIP